MKSFKTVDEYVLNVQKRQEILIVLRELIKTTELEETIKWGAPVYTLNGKNVIGIASFKSYVGLWFFHGALLKDSANVLINAQKEVTKALRQWRFTTVEEINDKLILNYLHEAIENQKQNKEIKPNRNKSLVIPDELLKAFKKDQKLEADFMCFTKGKQREFADYISDAKRVETRSARLQKIIPLIQQNIGLNDKYRK